MSYATDASVRKTKSSSRESSRFLLASSSRKRHKKTIHQVSIHSFNCTRPRKPRKMKFCKNLQRVVDISDPEWSPFWPNYKMLKVS